MNKLIFINKYNNYDKRTLDKHTLHVITNAVSQSENLHPFYKRVSGDPCWPLTLQKICWPF